MKRTSLSKPNKPKAKRVFLPEEPDVVAYANSDLHRFKDVIVCCGENGRFEANKIILACHSKHFEASFYGDDRIKVGDEVNVPHVKESEMKSILDCIYKKSIQINFGNVYDLISAANVLEIKKVKSLCFKFLQKNIDANNCFRIHRVASKCNDEFLRKEVILFIQDNHEEVMRCDSFQNLQKSDLKFFVQDLGSEENGTMETFRYDILSEWTQHDDVSRISDFADLVLLLNFNKLESEKLEDYVNWQDSHRDTQNVKLPKSIASTSLEKSAVKEKTSIIVSLGGVYSRTRVIPVGDPFYGKERNCANFPSLPEGRFWGCTEKLNEFVYFIGGYGPNCSVLKTVLRMNTTSNDLKWHLTSSLNEPRCQIKAAVLDGSICVVGGRGENKEVLNSGEYFLQDHWRHLCPLQQARAEHGLVACKGSLYAIGGYYDDNEALCSVECLSSIHRKWMFVKAMKTQRYRLVAVESGGVVYAIGGRTGWNKEILKSAEKYDIEKNEWTSISDMNFCRTGFSACVVNEKIFVFGGYDGERIVTEIECYEPSKNKWSVVGITNGKLLHHSVVALSFDGCLPPNK